LLRLPVANWQQRAVTTDKCKLRCCRLTDERTIHNHHPFLHVLNGLLQLEAEHEVTNVTTEQAVMTRAHPSVSLTVQRVYGPHSQSTAVEAFCDACCSKNVWIQLQQLTQMRQPVTLMNT
jgi:hypothetical protein